MSKTPNRNSRAYVEAQRARREAAIEAERIRIATVTPAMVLGELLHMARVDIGKAFNEDGCLKPIHEIPEDVRRAISGIDVEEMRVGGEAVGRVKKVRFWDKKGALELLGKHLALWVERHEHTGKNGDPIQHAVAQVPDEVLRERLAELQAKTVRKPRDGR